MRTILICLAGCLDFVRAFGPWKTEPSSRARIAKSGMLPGALIRNHHLKFICKDVAVRVETTNSPYTNLAKKGQILHIPIAHGEGCYVASDRTLDELEAEDRVFVRYVDNPNGSARDIAGILNERRNVMGMMPHPDRAADPLMGSIDGLVILRSAVNALESMTSPAHTK